MHVIFSSFCGYLNLGKHQCTILKQYRKFTSCCNIIVWTDYRRKYMLFSLNCTRKDVIMPILKGNNSCKTYNFRIKVGKVQTVYCYETFQVNLCGRTHCITWSNTLVYDYYLLIILPTTFGHNASPRLSHY